MKTVLLFVLLDVMEHIFEYSVQISRALSWFRGILREIIHHRPKVDQSAPVNVSEVCKQHVLFEVVEQVVVPAQAEVSQVRSVWVLLYVAEF